MSKLVSKLSRQIMAALLSVTMILPNMTVYASEASVPATQTEVSVVDGELNEEQPSLTEDETLPEGNDESNGGEASDDGVKPEEPASSTSITTNIKSLSNSVLVAEDPVKDDEVVLEDVTRVYNFMTDHYTASVDVASPDGKLVIKGSLTGNGNGHGKQMPDNSTIEIDVYPGETIYIAGCQYSPSNSKVDIKEGETELDSILLDVLRSSNTASELCGCPANTHRDAPTVNDTYAFSFMYTGQPNKWGKVTLTFTNTPYVSYIIVDGQEPKSTVTEVTASITFDAATKNLLGDGDVIKLVNITNEEEFVNITSANEGTEAVDFTLKPNTTYKIVSTNPDIEALTSEDESTISVREEPVSVTVKFAKTVVEPAVTYDIEEGLTVSDITLTLTNADDETETITLSKTDDEPVKLKIGATYKLLCTYADENVVLEATINDVSKLTVEKGLSEITIKVVEDKNAVPTIQRTTTYSFYHGSDAVSEKYGPCIVNPHDQNPLNFTSSDGSLTVKGGSCSGGTHGLHLATGSTITIHVLGKTEVIIGGCQYGAGGSYTMVSKPEGEAEKTIQTIPQGKTGGCFHQAETNSVKLEYDEKTETDLVITAGGELYVPAIIVNRTEPKPAKEEINVTVTLNDEDNLLKATDTITLVEKDNDEAEPIDITAAKTEPIILENLPIHTTYNIVSSNTDILAATDKGETSIVTGTEDMAVTIELSSTVVHPIVHVKRSANVPAETDLQLKLVNTASGSTEEVPLVDGQPVKLTIGATYRLEFSDAVDAKIDNGIRLTVDATLTEINVNVTKPDTSKHTIDVWDFGAEQLTSTDKVTYNNKLNEDIINAWYSDTPAGTSGVTIPSTGFETKDENGQTELYYNPNEAKNHRLRTQNGKLTRYDSRELTDIDDSTIKYQGNIYSNSEKQPNVYMQLAVKAGDIVTFAVSRNNGDSILNWESPSGSIDGSQTYTGEGSKAQRMTFYAKEDGNYKLYSVNEKLVVARIYRERPESATVSGTLTLPQGISWNDQAKVVFTNTITGQKTEAVVTNNSGELRYTVSLLRQYSYDISLEGIEGCIMGATNKLDIANGDETLTFNLEAITVDLVAVSGSLAVLAPADAEKLTMKFVNSEMIYVPNPKISIDTDTDAVTYSAKLEKDVVYDIVVAGVNDYELNTATITASAEAHDKDIQFTKKPVWPITVTLEGPTEDDAASKVALTFTNVKEEGYVYSFTGTTGIELRDGQYAVSAVLEGYTQKITSDLKVDGAAVSKTINMIKDVSDVPLEYKPTITVGKEKEYATINEALAAVRRMTSRTAQQRVTIAIDPGDYEEMLVVDVPNVTLKNASDDPSIELIDKGVHAAQTAVRITSYYGHGYTYYSMGPDCKWDGDLLKANLENGYPSFVNPGSGKTDGSYWNSTVVIDANGFQADGIIFENSFNQYVSQKASEDKIVPQTSAKEGSTPRADMQVGSVEVQKKAYVERAAALSITKAKKEISFNNCKFVGRQDTLYGDEDVTAAFYGCSVYGATDFIMGPMTAVFAKCDLVLNTEEDNNDVAYITAAQQKTGRGYLMYNCEVKSTIPGVDTNSAKVSKPGYFGRPWQGVTSEAVFYYTIIGTASDGTSLITPEGWNASLGGAAKAYEYGTFERTTGIDNSASRINWSKVLNRPIIDNEAISVAAFLDTWNPFAGKDMTIKLPNGTEISEADAIVEVIDEPTATPASGSEVKANSTVALSATSGLKVYYSMATGSAPADPTYDDQHLYEAPITLTGAAGDKIYIKVVAVKYDDDGTVNNYTDPITLIYTIKTTGSSKPGAGLEVELLSGKEYTYTGNAITPEIRVTNNGDELTPGVDYMVRYANNKNANADKAENKRAKITVTGKGSFSGNAFTYFTINPKSLTEDVNDDNPVVAGGITVVKKAKVAPILIYNGVKLAARDFTVVEPANGKFETPGTEKVKVTGKGNFTGEREIPVTVVESAAQLKKITAVQLTPRVTYVYDGTAKEPQYTVKSGRDEVINSVGLEDKYTIVYNRDNLIDVGTVKFTVIGMGEYTGSVTKSYNITANRNTVIDATLAQSSYEYVSTGVIIPDEDLTVKVGETSLIKDVDYKVTYGGNKKVTNGRATATCNVTFIGNYKGCARKSLKFAITPATINNETVTVFAADMVFKRANMLYKSVPSVVYEDEDGVKTLLKKSDYTVKYYLDADCTDAQEMTSRNKVMAADTSVYVKITGKGNYAPSDASVYATGVYKVRDLGSMKDLSKAKVEIYDKLSATPTRTTTKVEYTGEEIELDGTRYELKVNLGTARNPDYVPATEYDVEYADNISKGRATIVITAKDGSTTHMGSKTATFNIVAQKVKTDLLSGLFSGAAQNLADMMKSILVNE